MLQRLLHCLVRFVKGAQIRMRGRKISPRMTVLALLRYDPLIRPERVLKATQTHVNRT